MKQRFQLLLVVTALALALGLGACSNDEGGVAGPVVGSLAPLTANYFPLTAGAWWDFIRIESGIYSPDTTLNYFDPDVPSAYSRWECAAGERASDLVLRGSAHSQPDGGGELEHFLEVWIDQAGGGFELVGEDSPGATDSSFVYLAGAPYPWIRFGRLRWEQLLVDYSGESYVIDDGAVIDGATPLSDALGFDFTRTLYDGSNQPGNIPWDPSDVDFDTYLDGIRSVSFVGEVIAEEDFAYAQFGETAVDSLFPEMADVVFENCRWVRFSLIANIMLSNQRDPNVPPGQDAIPDHYLPARALEDRARLDVGMLLLAPNLGPVGVITYRDLDKQIKAGDPGDDMQIFQPDLLQADILVGSNLLP